MTRSPNNPLGGNEAAGGGVKPETAETLGPSAAFWGNVESAQLSGIPGELNARPAPSASGGEGEGLLRVRADLRKGPDGSVVFAAGEVVELIRVTGVKGCLYVVGHADGREGMWAATCFDRLPAAPWPVRRPTREEVTRIVRVAYANYAELPGRGHHTHRRRIAENAVADILEALFHPADTPDGGGE